MGRDHAGDDREARRFGQADLELAAELARRAATAVETSRLLRSLAQSEERYRLLFEASPLPMWVYDAQTCASSPSTRPPSATTATRAASSSP